MPSLPESEYMKIAEAARFLGVTQRWVYRRVLSGELPASKVGGLYLINRKDLQHLLDAGRVVPDAELIKNDRGKNRMKCGFCFRLLDDESEIAGGCEREGCNEVICQKCWNLDIHTCAHHSPTRDQRLKKAQEQLMSGLLQLMVKSSDARLNEINYLGRVHTHLKEFATIIHPSTGELINVSSWEEILETGDERAYLMHLMGKIALDSNSLSQMPLNAWQVYRFKTKTKKAFPFEIYVKSISRMETMVRNGFDSDALTRDDLAEEVEKLIESTKKNGSYLLAVLGSPCGWNKESRDYLLGINGDSFTHQRIMIYLYDMQSHELIFNRQEDRMRRYADLIQPTLPEEDLAELCQMIERYMGVNESISLAEFQQAMDYPPEKIKKAFDKLVSDGNYQMTEFKDLGIVLVKKQALQ